MFSSAAATIAISCPTGAVSPSLISRLRSTPSPRATTSMTALSVSTSARISPDLTASPSFFVHLTRRPSSIVGESASITTLVAIVYHSRYRTFFTAAVTFCASGFAALSRFFAYGIGTSA